jgi:hypothetical protein
MKNIYSPLSEINPVVYYNNTPVIKTPIEFVPQLEEIEKIKSFYLSPQKLYKNSMVNFLRDNYGITNDGKTSFNTTFINSKEITNYNGSQFFLSVEFDKVFLNVIKEKKISKVVFWNIMDIYNSMRTKNPFNYISNPDFVKKIIEKGWLKVNFNVSEIKDHGTKWKIII